MDEWREAEAFAAYQGEGPWDDPPEDDDEDRCGNTGPQTTDAPREGASDGNPKHNRRP
jgi:hypothetical protein